MRLSRAIRFIALGLAVFIVLMGLAIVVGQLRVVTMNSTSMQAPGVVKRGGAVCQGDLALVTKRLGVPLCRGALVVVELSNLGKSVITIRRVGAVAGDQIPNSTRTNGTTTIPVGYYYLLGDSTNALDSRQLGLFSTTQICARVICVIK